MVKSTKEYPGWTSGTWSRAAVGLGNNGGDVSPVVL